MDYYKELQEIAQIDLQDNIIGRIEKWKAHRESILHRAFTTILKYKNKYILQHRKHPVFDGCLDLSFSSHQLYKNGQLEDDVSAVLSSLNREWNVKKSSLIHPPKKIGSVYYEEKDPHSEYSDHEIDYIYLVELNEIPTPNYDFAYGFSLVEKRDLTKHFSLLFAPWVKKIVKELEKKL